MTLLPSQATSVPSPYQVMTRRRAGEEYEKVQKRGTHDDVVGPHLIGLALKILRAVIHASLVHHFFHTDSEC